MARFFTPRIAASYDTRKRDGSGALIQFQRGKGIQVSEDDARWMVNSNDLIECDNDGQPLGRALEKTGGSFKQRFPNAKSLHAVDDPRPQVIIKESASVATAMGDISKLNAIEARELILKEESQDVLQDYLDAEKARKTGARKSILELLESKLPRPELDEDSDDIKEEEDSEEEGDENDEWDE